MEVFLVKKEGKFVPMYGNDYEEVKKIPEGQEVKAQITRPRNAKHHRKYFALLRLVAANLPEELEIYTNINLLLDEIKFQLGYFELRESIDGNPYYTPKSISFGSMDQDEFTEFYTKSVDIIIKLFLKGADRDELLKEVVEYL